MIKSSRNSPHFFHTTQWIFIFLALVWIQILGKVDGENQPLDDDTPSQNGNIDPKKVKSPDEIVPAPNGDRTRGPSGTQNGGKSDDGKPHPGVNPGNAAPEPGIPIGHPESIPKPGIPRSGPSHGKRNFPSGRGPPEGAGFPTPPSWIPMSVIHFFATYGTMLQFCMLSLILIFITIMLVMACCFCYRQWSRSGKYKINHGEKYKHSPNGDIGNTPM